MHSFLARQALAFDGRSFTVLDLVVAGVHDGCWLELEREAAAGVAALAALAHRGEEPPADAVRAAGTAFRYERALLAREDLERWLAARELAVDDWRAHLRRRVARGLEPAAAEGDAAPVLRADALCSGTLRACAETVVAGAAAARALAAAGPPAEPAATEELLAAARGTVALARVPEEELAASAARATGLAAARRRLETEVAGAEAVADRIRTSALAWLRFETEEVTSPTEDAAREARLCIREDGATVAEVAAALGVAPVARTRLFAETPEELAARLAAAAPGELVGPLPAEDGFLLARLVAKERPAADDPAVAARARAELLAETIAKHAAGRVAWHVDL